MAGFRLDVDGVRARARAATLDDDGNVLVEGVTKHDPGPRDPDLMTAPYMPVSHRRRDVDLAAVYRVVHGLLPLLEVTPCDRVEAVSRIVRSHPTWSNRDIAEHVGTTDDVVAVHRRDSTRFRYQWLDKGAARADDEE